MDDPIRVSLVFPRSGQRLSVLLPDLLKPSLHEGDRKAFCVEHEREESPAVCSQHEGSRTAKQREDR